jgi:hypothetical protein
MGPFSFHRHISLLILSAVSSRVRQGVTAPGVRDTIAVSESTTEHRRMAFVDEVTAKTYRDAWEAWRKQVEHLHRVFLDGEKIGPDQIKGLLNREARAKQKYDAARLALLGLDESPLAEPAGDENPFKSA